MEDNMEIPFKVYTFWNEGDKPEVRRFGVLKSSADSFFFLSQKLVEVYPGLKDKNYTIAWKDEDGDDVVISSNLELMTALRFTNYESLKVYVYCKGESKQDGCNIFVTGSNPRCNVNMPAGQAANLHLGVVCDSCDSPVVGFRYKCTVCDDYDLCSHCEAAGCHPEHCMVRVPAPNMPRTLIKAAIKRSRQFLKTVSMADECPHLKRRRDRSGERKHRGHHGGYGHGEHGHHGGHGHHRSHHGNSGDEQKRRPRHSWLDTFATYMNEFANLAGDVDLNDDGTKAADTKNPEQKTQEQNTQEKKSANESTEAPKQPEPSTSANSQPRHPFIPPGINVENIGSLLQMFLQDIHKVVPETRDMEMGQGDRKCSAPESTTMDSGASAKSGTSMSSGASVKSEVSVKSESHEVVKENSPDKADDWTLINKEKDLMDIAASAPIDPTQPIGFNLSKEFHERVRIAEGTNIYPQLNTSTAVLDPKEPEQPPAATTASGPEPLKPVPTPVQPQAAPNVAGQQQRRQRHSKPHIDAAIEQMLSMGFTNDGGWLTQLLESKDGNIAAVLDLLTPVNPKK